MNNFISRLNYNKNNSKIIFAWIFILILIIDYSNSRTSDPLTLLAVLLWIVNIKVYKIVPEITLLLAVSFFFVALITLTYGNLFLVEKSCSYFIIFLLTAMIQKLITKHSRNEN